MGSFRNSGPTRFQRRVNHAAHDLPRHTPDMLLERARQWFGGIEFFDLTPIGGHIKIDVIEVDRDRQQAANRNWGQALSRLGLENLLAFLLVNVVQLFHDARLDLLALFGTLLALLFGHALFFFIDGLLGQPFQ